ncbi:hypothetical protein [Cytobacillus gottheilii]|uniref:hypothetical protein n=1 Tax=Cytobacillus gottheilii TaxID=859144 RepID=UPI000A444506|nr:hypothetical protein [Cytobacillus gottheilii]
MSVFEKLGLSVKKSGSRDQSPEILWVEEPVLKPVWIKGSLFIISGESSVILKITLKTAKIKGEIPAIGSKKVKKAGFVGDNRNFSAYLDQK